LTKNFLQTCEVREKFAKKLGSMMKVEKFGFPVKRGEFYYFDYANAEEEKAKTYKIKA
jgi:hypothetical protein